MLSTDFQRYKIAIGNILFDYEISVDFDAWFTSFFHRELTPVQSAVLSYFTGFTEASANDLGQIEQLVLGMTHDDSKSFYDVFEDTFSEYMQLVDTVELGRYSIAYDISAHTTTDAVF